jgi:hypothetical protein
MFILDSLLIGGLRFVLDQIAAAADAESQDGSGLRDELLEAQMRLELGEISETEFAATERRILARLRELRGDQDRALTVSRDDMRITGVEVAAVLERGGNPRQ